MTSGDGVILVTGGAGFIGTNLTDRLARAGRRVRLFDNLSRPGVERNLAWLKATHDERIVFVHGDMRDRTAITEAAAGVDAVFHFAAQVAVTTSLATPRHDFEVNALGTLNLLEALRVHDRAVPLLFTSTNKVYGALDDLPLRTSGERYLPEDGRRGIAETRCLDFQSPYGCSKGAADQYVLDYARSYGLPAVVFRMSCIYGPHQFGTEDQGWVAHFLLSALAGRPITIYGDGRQVRDVLHVDDLVDAMLLAVERHRDLAGQAFNIGGGAANAISLRELVGLIGRLGATAPRLVFGPQRIGDQRYYVSDHGRFTRASGWRPRIGFEEGVASLYRWLAQHRAEAGAAWNVAPLRRAGTTAGTAELRGKKPVRRIVDATP